MPAAKHFSASPPSAFAVHAMIGVRGWPWRASQARMSRASW
jgi:hypothetical protein